MAENIKTLDRLYTDHHGIVVNVIGYDRIGQRVIYRRAGYEWECASPVIIFRAKFTRIDTDKQRNGS